MGLSNLLLENGHITEEQLEAASERQRLAGGFVFENLVSMGFVERDQVDQLYRSSPPIPRTLEATGLEEQYLLDFILRSMYISAHQTVAEISREVKLAKPVVEILLTLLRDRSLVEIAGTAKSHFLLRHVLTERGRTVPSRL